MTDAVNYGAAPAEGSVLEWSDQEYLVEKVISFTVKGERFAELSWRTGCAECGEALRFKTGLHKRYLRKRCKICDPSGERDKAERSRFAKAAWSERMRKARAEKAGPVAAPRIENATLSPRKIAMFCDLVYPGGRRETLSYAPGMALEGEDDTPAMRAAIPALAAEFERLKEADAKAQLDDLFS